MKLLALEALYYGQAVLLAAVVLIKMLIRQMQTIPRLEFSDTIASIAIRAGPAFYRHNRHPPRAYWRLWSFVPMTMILIT